MHPQAVVPIMRFSPIEGMRGYLAIWVAIGHALQLGGVVSGNRLMTLLLDGGSAVKVFIIISGFVITHLLISKQEAYAPYIVRRYFRLFPAFAVTCIAGYFLAQLYVDFGNSVPWANAPFWEPIRAIRSERLHEIRTDLLAQVAAHITMLHGAISHHLLPGADKTFDPPAWSISLEWQFYLVAPMVLAALRTRVGAIALVATALVFYALYARGTLGTYDDISTLAAASGYFAVGIASRIALPFLQRLKISASPAIAVFFVAMLSNDRLPLAIWAAFYTFLIWDKSAAFRHVFANPLMLYLGKISYSIYLVHVLTMIVIGYVVTKLGFTQFGILAALFGSIAVSVGISALLYVYVEKPGIALGSRIAKRLTGSPAGLPVVS